MCRVAHYGGFLFKRSFVFVSSRLLLQKHEAEKEEGRSTRGNR